MDSLKHEDDLSSVSRQTSDHTPEVVLVCGPVNAGKTGIVSRFVGEMRQRGIRVCGVLSHGVWGAGKKVGIVVENIASGETRPLASVDSGSSATQQGKYKFFDDGLYFGIKALLDAADAQVIVIDEIGPLELREQGFAQALRNLLRCATGLVIIVVRERLTEETIEHFQLRAPKVASLAEKQTFDFLRSIVTSRYGHTASAQNM